jgi:hypothetical protein
MADSGWRMVRKDSRACASGYPLSAIRYPPP